MRSYEMRLAAVTLAIALTYAYVPSANDSSAAPTPYTRTANGVSLNGRSVDGRQMDERAKGRLSANGSSLQGETEATTGASDPGGMSVISIKLPPTAQPGRICLKCR